MSPMFLADPALQKKQQEIWTKLPTSAIRIPSPMRGDTLLAVLNGIKASVDKIRSRGGRVTFVRPPSSGNLLKDEMRLFPRQEYWDRLLEYTNTPGIHFSDHPAIAYFSCPEWSHLAPEDAVIYTRYLVKILQDEQWWAFHQ